MQSQNTVRRNQSNSSNQNDDTTTQFFPDTAGTGGHDAEALNRDGGAPNGNHGRVHDGDRHDATRVENYSVDGSDNNASQSSLNAVGSDMRRIAPANFAEGTTNTPVDGPNPREISNVLVAGTNGAATVEDPNGLAGMMYAFGQFIDHDLDLNRSTPRGPGNNIDITIPEGDPNFAPGTTIPLTRAVVDPQTGAPINSITGWLDLSQVYGSDATKAASLRTSDGHLATSDGDNLPIVNGMFAAGDVRVSENPDLTALQTMFVREHNRVVDQLAADHPSLGADELFNQSRAIVTAEYQNIVYSEFLPHLLGPTAIADYHGYDSTVDPRITAEFAGAAYRFGHSIVSEAIDKTDNKGSTLEEKSLAESFFLPPSVFAANGGADGLLRHLSSDHSQNEDIYIVDSLRNLLVDTPDGQDLAAINIARGRDLGLGTLDQTRSALGLTPYTSFDQITSDPVVAANLQTVYGSVDKVDLWAGGLAEDHAPGAMVGSTFQAIIGQQFTALRDGDRLYFENQDFNRSTTAQIESTTLSDVMLRDSDTTAIQADAFLATSRHSSDVASDDPTAPQLVIGIDADGALIAGGTTDDTLVAGFGQNQMLTGGDGADVFAFNGPGHVDTVTDFAVGVDRLDFGAKPTGNIDTPALSSAPDGSAIVSLGGNTVTLAGVTTQQLGGADFLTKSNSGPLTS